MGVVLGAVEEAWVDCGAPFVAEVGSESYADECCVAGGVQDVLDEGFTACVAGLDEDDSLAGSGSECAHGLEFGVGGEYSYGALEVCHVGGGYDGVWCIGRGAGFNAPGFAADV